MKTLLLWTVLVVWLFTMPITAQEEPYISAIAYSKVGNHLALGYSDGRLEVFAVEGTILGDRLFTELGGLGMSRVDELEWHPLNNDVLLVSTRDEAYVLNVKLPASDIQGGVLASRIVWSADGTQIFANYAPDGIFYQTDILNYPSFETSEIKYSGPVSILKFNPLRTRSVFSKFGNFPGTYVQNNNEELLYTFTFPEAIYDIHAASYVDWDNGVIALGDRNYLGLYDEDSYAPLWIETADTDALSFFWYSYSPSCDANCAIE